MENVYIEQPTIILKGDNKREELVIQPDRIVYLHAADNYTRIFFVVDDQVQTVLFRSTLKKQEELLARYPSFYRCHKKYLVNFQYVFNITGNAINLKLHVKGVFNLIPVSRNLHQQTMDVFNQCSKYACNVNPCN
jgi:DNA-binding LytR/AlgR family response regulator